MRSGEWWVPWWRWHDGDSSRLTRYRLRSWFSLACLCRAVCMVLGFVMERVAYRPLRGAPRLAPDHASAVDHSLLPSMWAPALGCGFPDHGNDIGLPAPHKPCAGYRQADRGDHRQPGAPPQRTVGNASITNPRTNATARHSHASENHDRRR